MLSFEFLLYPLTILKLDFEKVRENPVVPGPRVVWNYGWDNKSVFGFSQKNAPLSVINIETFLNSEKSPLLLAGVKIKFYIVVFEGDY